MTALPETLTRFRAVLQSDVPLAKYTAARMGGNADWVYVANGERIETLVEIVTAAWAADMPVRVVGGGANVLVSDAGVRGLVIVNRTNKVEFDLERAGLRALSGVSLTRLAQLCALRGLRGFEWAVSVPGSIGGAVVNNAGAHGGDMAANVASVELLDVDDGPVTLGREALAYGYRTSALKQRADKRFFVVAATLLFERDNPDAVQARGQANIARRKATQPQGASLGSIFKNPAGDYAGRLIEAAGLKGLTIGGAQVSPVHANFFINTGGASAADYYALIQQVQQTVADRFGVQLELEIELLGVGFSQSA